MFVPSPFGHVEDNCVDALEGWIDQEPAGQNTLRDKPQSCARADVLFETDPVANRSANLFVQLPRASSCSQACRNPARLDDFAADKTENAGGTRVVFPVPGGASMTRLLVCCRDTRISGRIASTGSAGFRLTILIGTRHFPRRQCCSSRPNQPRPPCFTSVLIIGLCPNVNSRPKSVSYCS